IWPAAASTAVAARRASTTVTALAAWWRRLLRRRWGAAFGRRVLVSQHRLARQFHAVVLVDGDDLHLDLVADAHHVFDLADVLVVQLADVAQSIAAGRDLDEGAEILDRRDLALVDLADANLFG